MRVTISRCVSLASSVTVSSHSAFPTVLMGVIKKEAGPSGLRLFLFSGVKSVAGLVVVFIRLHVRS